MVGSFSFPPPPPPPPVKAVVEASPIPGHGAADRGGRGRGRGRGGGDRGAYSQEGRGRGRAGSHQNRWTNGSGAHDHHVRDGHDLSRCQAHFGHQQPRDRSQVQGLPTRSYVNPNFGQSTGREDGSPQSQALDPPALAGHPRTVAGHKRKLDALRPPSRDRSQPRIPAAPPVPSFGPPILPSKPVAAVQPANLPKPKESANALGLTPGINEPIYSSDDDNGGDKDVDEEAMFTELGCKLTFEHNGVVMSLKSAADLAAWREERRKNWPTKARMSEKEMQKCKTGEERKRLLAGMLALQTTSASATERSLRGAHITEKLCQAQVCDEKVKPSGTKLEKARRELAQQSHRLEALRQRVYDSQAALDRAQAEKEERDYQASMGHAVDEHDTIDGSDGSDISTVLSKSSVVTSDSSEPDEPGDDGPPEEATAKGPSAYSTSPERSNCRYYYASGHCRDGDHCRFRHELGPGVQKAPKCRRQAQRDPHALKLDKMDRERTGIYQRLMGQQQEEEAKLAVKVIKYLGKKGFFSSAA